MSILDKIFHIASVFILGIAVLCCSQSYVYGGVLTMPQHDLQELRASADSPIQAQKDSLPTESDDESKNNFDDHALILSGSKYDLNDVSKPITFTRLALTGLPAGVLFPPPQR